MIYLIMFLSGTVAWVISTAAAGAATLLIPVIGFLLGALSWQAGIYGILLGLGAVVGVYIARMHLLNIHLERFRNYTLAIMAISGVLMLVKAL